MTTLTTVDTVYLQTVERALATHVQALSAEAAAADAGWVHAHEHRGLAARLKAFVAAVRTGWATASPGAGEDQLLGLALRLAAELRQRQYPSGLFMGGDNVESPPDTAFSVNDLADALFLLRGHPAPTDAVRALDAAVDEILTAVTPALLTGGVHTPNHRWELASALARLHRLTGDAAPADRAAEWLAEGVDQDGDGLYSERSANYAVHVSNPSLLALATILERPELAEAVERNLDATLDLILPDGAVETVLSRRQDQAGHPFPLAGYLLPLRHLAAVRQRGDFAWAAGIALAQGIADPAAAAAAVLLQPETARILPAPVAPARPRLRHFTEAGLVTHHAAGHTAVVFGGSDHGTQRRIRSGLANSPVFLRLLAGHAVLDGVRLSRTFFGLGPFRAQSCEVTPGPDGTVVTLRETVSGSYYQPLAAADRDPQGRYLLGDEGRFSAAMDFPRRARTEVALTTTVEAVLLPDGAELTVDITGAAVDWLLEFAFRPGGDLTGELAASAGGSPSLARYDWAGHRIEIAVLETSDGAGGPLLPARTPGGYLPGEEYAYLGGSDAARGALLHLTARAPSRVRVRVTAHDAPPDRSLLLPQLDRTS